MTSPSTAATLSIAAASMVANQNATVTSDGTSSVHTSAPSEPIFLQTTLAKGIAGVFVWAALFLTCQQPLHKVITNLEKCQAKQKTGSVK